MNLKNWTQWLHGLGAAIVGSFATLGGSAAVGWARDYDLFDWSFWEPLIGAVLLNMWVSVQLYIRQFPPPGMPVPQLPPKS